ncbi:DUF3613 domain-containing protein [Pseudomonas putida]|uniref:DUF3613 domain-containing protein n=1 Tax=Pseudomonas putida TaxID=303 RepID=UPI003D02F064
MLRPLMVMMCLAAPAIALADDAPRQTGSEESATETLLRIQASNQQASPTVQVQTAREREQSMQRWLDSYKYAIPDFYRWEKVSSSN